MRPWDDSHLCCRCACWSSQLTVTLTKIKNKNSWSLSTLTIEASLTTFPMFSAPSLLLPRSDVRQNRVKNLLGWPRRFEIGRWQNVSRGHQIGSAQLTLSMLPDDVRLMSILTLQVVDEFFMCKVLEYIVNSTSESKKKLKKFSTVTALQTALHLSIRLYESIPFSATIGSMYEISNIWQNFYCITTSTAMLRRRGVNLLQDWP